MKYIEGEHFADTLKYTSYIKNASSLYIDKNKLNPGGIMFLLKHMFCSKFVVNRCNFRD